MSEPATPLNPQPAPITVGEVLTLYLRHAAAENVHVPEARVDRERIFAAFIERYGNLPVTEAKAFHLTDFVDAHPGWKSVATRRAKANMIRAAFAWAANNERIDRHPFKIVRYGEAEPRPPMPDDVFVDLLDISNKRFERAVRFLRLIGCRLSELCILEWPMIDLEKGQAVIDKHKSRRYTGKAKVIALVPEAVELLQAIRSKQPEGYEGHVFLNNRNTPWTRRSLGQQLRRMKVRGEISTNASLHGLRHAFGTEGIKNGAPLKLISMALGHASTAITEKFYCHITEKDVDAIRQAALAAQPKNPVGA